MASRSRDDRSAFARARWWIAWTLITIIVVAGAILAVRLGPGVTPVLDATR